MRNRIWVYDKSTSSLYCGAKLVAVFSHSIEEIGPGPGVSYYAGSKSEADRFGTAIAERMCEQAKRKPPRKKTGNGGKGAADLPGGSFRRMV